MTQVASALYFQTQRYWRATDPKSPVKPLPDAEQVAAIRQSLDECYQASRIAGEAIEARLKLLFERKEVYKGMTEEAVAEGKKSVPWRLWHAVMDLLTVRYFQLLKGDTDGLLKMNSGPDHSFLTTEQLKNPKTVLDAYRQRLFEATKAVLNSRPTSKAGLIGS